MIEMPPKALTTKVAKENNGLLPRLGSPYIFVLFVPFVVNKDLK